MRRRMGTREEALTGRVFPPGLYRMSMRAFEWQSIIVWWEPGDAIPNRFKIPFLLAAPGGTIFAVATEYEVSDSGTLEEGMVVYCGPDIPPGMFTGIPVFGSVEIDVDASNNRYARLPGNGPWSVSWPGKDWFTFHGTDIIIPAGSVTALGSLNVQGFMTC